MTFKHIPDRPQSLTAEYVTLRYKARPPLLGFQRRKGCCCRTDWIVARRIGKVPPCELTPSGGARSTHYLY